MSTRRLLAVLLACLAWSVLPAPARAQQSADPSFNLVNRTGRQINEIYVSPSSVDNWGQDRLGQAVLPNGQSFAVRLPQGECVYDVRVVFQGGGNEERRRLNTCNLTEVVFAPGGAGAAPTGPTGPTGPGNAQTQNPSFNLVNNSGRIINNIYVSASSDNNWGPDRLGQAVLPNGQSFAVQLPLGNCIYDVRVVYQGGNAEERRRQNTCAITNMTFP